MLLVSLMENMLEQDFIYYIGKGWGIRFILEQDYIYYIGEGGGDKIHAGAGLYILHWGGGGG